MTALLRACSAGLWCAGCVSWVAGVAHWAPAGVVMTLALVAGWLAPDAPRTTGVQHYCPCGVYGPDDRVCRSCRTRRDA